MNRQWLFGLLVGLLLAVALGAMQQARRQAGDTRFHFVPISEKVAWVMDDQYGTFYYINLDDKETPLRNLGSTGNAAGRKQFE